MQITLTGATGFIGRYIANHLAGQGHSLRCWLRPSSNREGFDQISDLQWVEGDLGDRDSAATLVEGCNAVVHAALCRPEMGFRGAEGDLVEFVQKNLVGTLELIEAARRANVDRFVFISTCAVHEKILDDRPLDEAHPLWASSHYGAHKAAIEKFVHSYGLGQGYPICAVRPTGVYVWPVQSRIANGTTLFWRSCAAKRCSVHLAARKFMPPTSVGILLTADINAGDTIAGEAFNCYDRYVSEFDVATLAKELSGSTSQIIGQPMQPKHQIVTDKIRSLGMQFGGDALLKRTVAELVQGVGGEIR